LTPRLCCREYTYRYARDSDSDPNAYFNTNVDANSLANSDGYRNSHANSDRYPNPYAYLMHGEMYANAAASPHSATAPVTFKFVQSVADTNRPFQFQKTQSTFRL